MKEIKIITKGRPNLEHLPKNEAKVFYSTLLLQAIEYFKAKELSTTKEHLVENETEI